MNDSKTLALGSLKYYLLGWGMVFVFILFNSLGAFILKQQIQKLGSHSFSSPAGVVSFFFSLFSSWTAWTGLISISIATGAWIIALAHLELSKAFPVAIGVNLLVTIASSILYFHEPLTLFKVFGTGFILLGVILFFL